MTIHSRELPTGTKVQVRVRGVVHEGRVFGCAINWAAGPFTPVPEGKPDDWHIEFKTPAAQARYNDHVSDDGFVYRSWKQSQDGGELLGWELPNRVPCNA